MADYIQTTWYFSNNDLNKKPFEMQEVIMRKFSRLPADV